jgi:Na+-translocating ferredoxin:NAD+ oxidoreductase RnfE subunit
VWLLVCVIVTLVERVLNAFVEDLLGVVRPIGTLCAGNCIGEAEIREKRRQVVRVKFNSEFLVEEVLNLLFLPGLLC